MSAHARLVVAVLLACSTVSACTGLQGGDDHDGPEPDGATADPAEFCDAMEHLTGECGLNFGNSR